MASLFARLDRVAMATLEQVYGEAFEHRPRAKPSGAADVNARSSIADGARSIQTVTAIYTDREVPGRMSDLYDPRSDQRPGVTAREHIIEVDQRVVAIDVRLDDVFVRVADGRRFSVVSIHVTDVGRLLCHVNVL
jgi:hypothetical protein